MKLEDLRTINEINDKRLRLIKFLNDLIVNKDKIVTIQESKILGLKVYIDNHPTPRWESQYDIDNDMFASILTIIQTDIEKKIKAAENELESLGIVLNVKGD